MSFCKRNPFLCVDSVPYCNFLFPKSSSSFTCHMPSFSPTLYWFRWRPHCNEFKTSFCQEALCSHTHIHTGFLPISSSWCPTGLKEKPVVTSRHEEATAPSETPEPEQTSEGMTSVVWLLALGFHSDLFKSILTN